MEITRCPECHDETVLVGLAYWSEFSEPVSTVACVSDDCGWADVAVEVALERVTHRIAA